MANDNLPTDRGYDWATDTEPFFVFLGIYVAAFQSIEGKLEEIILLQAGHEIRAATLERLARMRNYEKIAAVAAAAVDQKRFRRIVAHPDWNERVAQVIEHLDAERVRRNTILHSLYWLRGLELGLNAIRTDKKRKNGEIAFETEEMNRSRMDAILNEISTLAFDTGQLHLQLVAWTP